MTGTNQRLDATLAASFRHRMTRPGTQLLRVARIEPDAGGSRITYAEAIEGMNCVPYWLELWKWQMTIGTEFRRHECCVSRLGRLRQGEPDDLGRP
jgi:hypothetical protein